MSKPAATIRCKATLLQPAAPAGASGRFLLLPAAASKKLPTRSMVAVAGIFAGHPAQATLQPDGQGGHWRKVERALQRASGVAAGETVTLAIAPVEEEPEPQVPEDLHAALADHPNACDLGRHHRSGAARLDLPDPVGEKAQTRVKRMATTCDMLASGKRRACCFDRSGMYGKSLAAPTPKAG
ncbi:hypothetical protein XBLMG947_3579 [Xanthomonas bromi]|uniref:DUF1905 domain-containing protein n=1 Tax=Xanthomonas bromi TaxID=56449 RepID=A0A1C3NQY1_9XANT|nr:hypothetical protein XBLMG947_3579 [Xanthomonas bromi]